MFNSSAMTNWQQYITSDEHILQGKPIIKGTRISVEFILERLADGWSEQEILENYPRLTPEAMKAVYAYLYEGMKDGLLFSTKKNRA